MKSLNQGIKLVVNVATIISFCLLNINPYIQSMAEAEEITSQKKSIQAKTSKNNDVKSIKSIAASTQEKEDLSSNEHNTGLTPFTPEQEEQFRKEHKKIQRINLNNVGWQRVNAERKKKGFYELKTESIIPKGKEIEASFMNEKLSGSTIQIQQSVSTAEATEVLPTYVDNSKTAWFPPIKNQGGLNSCASFVTTYTQLSYMVAFQKGLTINTSDNTNKYSPKWTYNMINQGMNSATYISDNYKLLNLHGAALWSEFPYDSNYLEWCPESSVWRNALSARIEPVQYVYEVNTSMGLQQLKELLTNGYILVFGTYINSWQYTAIKDDPAIVDDDAFVGKSAAYWLNGTQGSHAMVIVGYNDKIWIDINKNNIVDDGEKGALRIANSWGTGWGDAGFAWLAYDALQATSAVSGGPSTNRVKAIHGNMVYQMTVKDNYSPKLIAEFTASHLKRSQLYMSLGIGDSASTIPSTIWYPYPSGFLYKGGEYAFDGATSEVDGTFILDYTDIMSVDGSNKRYYLGIKDIISGDSGELKSYKLVDLVNNNEVYSSNLPQTVDNNYNSPVYAYIDYSFLDTSGSSYGIAEVRPYFLSGQEINDAVKVRYKFKIANNQGTNMKILFGGSRLYGTSSDTYYLERNLYTSKVNYADPLCDDGWAKLNQMTQGESTLRIAVPDYVGKGKTGVKTYDSANFPRITYIIDGTTGTWKTDMISQINLNGKEGTIETSRGNVISDKSGWKCSGSLDSDTYRQWDVTATIDGQGYKTSIALPENGAKYFTSYELINFRTEFFQNSGLFKVYLWDFEIQREGKTSWESLTNWKVTDYDGDGSNYGIKKATYNGKEIIEISNDSSGQFLAENKTFELSQYSTDTTPPTGGTVSINSGSSYTKTTAVTLSLSASDNVGVTGYYIAESVITPSLSASGWKSLIASASHTLSTGDGSKTVYVWYKDAAGNVSATVSDSITLDTTAPAVTISNPTLNDTYSTTSSTISISGSASDSASGIKTVAWSSNKGGSGAASGTTSWSIGSIGLYSGTNVITVTASDNAGNIGTDTITITNTSGTTPTVTTGSATAITASSATLNGTVNANGVASTVWFEYGTTSGSYGSKTASQSVSGTSSVNVSTTLIGLSAGKTYYYRIAGQNSAGTVYGSEKSFTSTASTDTTKPISTSISINGGTKMYTISRNVIVNLAATDNVGVTAYYVSENANPDLYQGVTWTPVTSTTSFKKDVSFTLSTGDGNKYVYAWYKDAGGNISDKANTQIILDTAVPTVTITSPTSDSTYTSTSSTISLGGSASDTTSGIKSVSWSNSLGGSGTASGTTSWNASGISLSSGSNVITVTASDNAGNTVTDTLTVSYSVNTKPSGSITINSGADYTNNSNLNVSISASDDKGVTGYYLSTSFNTPSLTTAGWTTISSMTSYTGSIQKSVGVGSITLYCWFKDSDGNISAAAATDTIYVDPQSPSISITSPTSADTYSATALPLSLGGSVSDGESGISSVKWSNNGGSETAASYNSSTNTWSVSLSSLSSTQDNVITVRARDKANNAMTDTITIKYNPSTGLSGSITINSGASHTTSNQVTLNLKATDDEDVYAYQVSPSNVKTSSWVISSTIDTAKTSYTENVSYTLQSGDGTKTMYVWYKDIDQNEAGPYSDSIILDTTAPTVTITSPTSGLTYTSTSSTISLSGNASDITSGIKSVSWSNSLGGSGA